MAEEEDVCKEHFEYTVEINGWNYPPNEADALKLFQSLLQLQH